jgi:hypothetical protein
VFGFYTCEDPSNGLGLPPLNMATPADYTATSSSFILIFGDEVGRGDRLTFTRQ